MHTKRFEEFLDCAFFGEWKVIMLLYHSALPFEDFSVGPMQKQIWVPYVRPTQPTAKCRRLKNTVKVVAQWFVAGNDALSDVMRHIRWYKTCR
jgi:hypothetical protein